ncbi:MAG: NUDIX domain-containing protein [Gammaproteobacteria bacterium]
MTRQLLLLRHGKSDWDADVSDFHRPLKARGKRGAQRMGAWLARIDQRPDFIISSPAERAFVTAEKCAKAMGLAADAIVPHKGIYEAGLDDLLKVLAAIPADAQRVMLVGHNPGLEQLLEYLSKEQPIIPGDGKLMPTATLARLEMPDDWQSIQPRHARLLGITRPRELPEQFPFEAEAGEQWRDRPSYYYTQSGVIPYRLEKGELRILLVRSSKRKHWVVPKGVADPGHSLEDSALKEAREEAGVLGHVDGPLLGRYQYEKWGAACEVTMFPMKVTEVLPEDKWEESHRGRTWVTVSEAKTLVKQRALVPMIESLQGRVCPE